MEIPAFTDDPVIEGRYRLVAILGTGGMGQVYEAIDEKLGRSVALKLVRTTDATLATRLRAEATVLASLHHPNLVTVFDAGEHDGRPFIVTELVRGRPLRQRMDEGPIAPDQLARIGAQTASALACAHSHGIVHRDITPGNVLLDDETGDARLIDFGIAVTDHALGLTSTGEVIGTPAYLSPEQVEGGKATPASDVYSLGLVLTEGLQGRRVYPGTPIESASARLVGEVPIPTDLPPEWGPLLTAMTLREPDLRPSADSVVRRLCEPPLVGASQAIPTGVVLPGTSTARGPDQTLAMASPGDTTLAFEQPMLAGPVRVPTTAKRRHRWALLFAGIALAAAVLVLAAIGTRTDTGQTPGGETSPSTIPTDQPAAATPTTTSTTAIADTPVPAADPGGSSQDRGQGKAKGKAD